MCSECIEKIRQYVTEDKPYFFNEAKKLLFQYCIPIAENNRRLKIQEILKIMLDNFCYYLRYALNKFRKKKCPSYVTIKNELPKD